MIELFVVIGIILLEAGYILFIRAENNRIADDASRLEEMLFDSTWAALERDKFKAALEEIAAFNNKVGAFENSVSFWSGEAVKLSRRAEMALIGF